MTSVQPKMQPELPAWKVQKRGGGHRAPASEPRAAAAELARARQCPRRIESVKAVNINALHA
jgi:hypothetical protein